MRTPHVDAQRPPSNGEGNRAAKAARISPEDELDEQHDVRDEGIVIRAPAGPLRRLAGMLRRAGRMLHAGRWWWPFLIAYAVLGWWLAVRMDLIVLDSLSRSSSAAFVWHNGPPKLAAIGFAWPPLTTLPLLLFTTIPALAQTGLAAMLLCAVMMSATIPLVRSELGRIGIPTWGAISVSLLLAAHPMIVFYGSNGMSEATGMLFLVATLVGTIRWLDTGSSTALAVASFAAAAAMMARYELVVVPVVLGAGALVLTALRYRNILHARAIAVFVLVPSIFVLVVWMYFNWAVQGSPTWFLEGGNQASTVAGTASTVGNGDPAARLDRVEAVRAMLVTHALFAPLLMVVAGATVVLVVRRRWSALLVAALVFIGLVVPLLIAVIEDNSWMAQLRFNMRTIPVSIIGAAWMLREVGALRTVHGRHLVSVLLVAAGAAAIPASVHWMRAAPLSFSEPTFLAVVANRTPMTGTIDAGGQAIGCRSARSMGQWIERSISRRDTILADTSSSFAVLTYSGHPERFVDTIDHGSAYFNDMLENPVARIEYVLASDFSTCSGVTTDAISARYPELYSSGNDGHLSLVHEVRGFRLYAVTTTGFERAPRGTVT